MENFTKSHFEWRQVMWGATVARNWNQRGGSRVRIRLRKCSISIIQLTERQKYKPIWGMGKTGPCLVVILAHPPPSPFLPTPFCVGHPLITLACEEIERTR